MQWQFFLKKRWKHSLSFGTLLHQILRKFQFSPESVPNWKPFEGKTIRRPHPRFEQLSKSLVWMKSLRSRNPRLPFNARGVRNPWKTTERVPRGSQKSSPTGRFSEWRARNATEPNPLRTRPQWPRKVGLERTVCLWVTLFRWIATQNLNLEKYQNWADGEKIWKIERMKWKLEHNPRRGLLNNGLFKFTHFPSGGDCCEPRRRRQADNNTREKIPGEKSEKYHFSLPRFKRKKYAAFFGEF